MSMSEFGSVTVIFGVLGMFAGLLTSFFSLKNSRIRGSVVGSLIPAVMILCGAASCEDPSTLIWVQYSLCACSTAAVAGLLTYYLHPSSLSA